MQSKAQRVFPPQKGKSQVAESADYRGVRWSGIPRRAKLPVRFYAHGTIGVIARLIC
jgi:hypothetical protein